MRRKTKSKTISIGMAILWMFTISIIVGTKDVHASAIQTQPPAKIFAASCSTCHGAQGLGGVTFVKDDFISSREAPKLVGRADLTADNIKNKVRLGSINGAMPAFGPEEITATELTQLIAMLQATANASGLTGSSIPTAAGTVVRLDILDADPWFMDDGTDSDGSNPSNSGSKNVTKTGINDVRRVDIDSNQTLKVVNTGRTWHTFTNSKAGISKDSGFIGYAGNYKNTPGDLGEIGYYYAEQSDLADGCKHYLCKMHPYMQVEVCKGTGTDATHDNEPGKDIPAGPSVALGLTRAHKHPIASPLTFGAAGEIWVTTQSQEETTEVDANGNGILDTMEVVSNSVSTMDGTYQVINTGTWALTDGTDADADTIINNVGNNPHNAWAGLDSGTNPVVLSASWHDNGVSLIDATAKKVLMERRSGADNAHVMTTPPHTAFNSTDSAGRFFISHMGGRAIQEIDVDQLRLGNDPNSNVTGGMIRGATGPHGLWMCDDGRHVLTADTFGASATLYDIKTKKRATASSGGKSPLAPAIFGTRDHNGIGSTLCTRGFTNNALTTDVSVYNISAGTTDTADTIARSTTAVPALIATVVNDDGALVAGNIRLRNTLVDQVLPMFVGTTTDATVQRRWVHLPIQTPVSPAGSGHGRYMVTANKASFNVSITSLDTTTGNPIALYTFPAGLGAHGVTYGQKSSCAGSSPCYYAYVTNTFEDYVSVYDLEKIPTAGAAGSALIAERIYVEGGAVAAVAALDPVVAGLCDVLDYSVDAGTTIDAGEVIDDFRFDAAVGGYDGDGDDGTGVLQCGVGPLGLYVANLPMGVLCPDCMSGVHVGDIPLQLTTGAPLAGATTGPLGWCDAGEATLGTITNCDPVTNTGTDSKYTYLKEDVWIDTETITCYLDWAGVVGAANVLEVNDCDGSTGEGGVDIAGTLNQKVELDLDLGINTGGQGIMGRNTSNGKAGVAPWQP